MDGQIKHTLMLPVVEQSNAKVEPKSNLVSGDLGFL